MEDVLMNATFEIQSWDESPVQEWDGGKLTHASVTKRFSGDIEGDAVLQYVMAYREDGTAAFVGIERIAGSAGGRKGGLVLQHVGNYADGAATATLTVVSGTDDLADASGSGEMVADPAGRVTLDLE
jgi:Protein of unknown function (DUF3224)